MTNFQQPFPCSGTPHGGRVIGEEGGPRRPQRERLAQVVDDPAEKSRRCVAALAEVVVGVLVPIELAGLRHNVAEGGRNPELPSDGESVDDHRGHSPLA